MREGSGITAGSVWKEMGPHPTATIASREVTSFPPSALCSSPQRRSGRRLCQAGSMSPMGGQRAPSSCCAYHCIFVPAPTARAGGICCQVGLGPLGLYRHGLNHCFPSFPVSHQGLAMTHRAGWPGPDFGIGGCPIRILYKTQWWLVMRSSVTETRSDVSLNAGSLCCQLK